MRRTGLEWLSATTPGRYCDRMADNHGSWRTQAPKGMHATIYTRRCGWHVLLHQTGPTIQSCLKPVLIGKSCVPYKVDVDQVDGQDQAEALAIGLCNIASHAPETCNNL